MVQIALIQMLVEGGNKQKNLSHALQLITEAADKGSDILLLPETLDLGWTHPSALQEAEPIPLGYPALVLCEAAKRNQVFICAGITEKEQSRIFNTAILINPEGEIILKHRKIHELDIAHSLYQLGRHLQAVHTPFGHIGVMICADAFAREQVLSRSLGYMGADLILSPCAWAVPAGHDNQQEPYGQLWRDNYQPVAKDFAMVIAGVSNVGWINDGPWKGRQCIGCSLVIDADGNELIQGPYGPDAEAILYVQVKLRDRPAQGTWWDDYWKSK